MRGAETRPTPEVGGGGMGDGAEDDDDAADDDDDDDDDDDEDDAVPVAADEVGASPTKGAEMSIAI
jgi:hypothetical protein